MTDRDDKHSKSDAELESHRSQGASPARRRLLKALVGAGGVMGTAALLPEKWSRPLVNRLMVPAHAQATAVTYAGGSSGPGPAPREGLGNRLLDTLIPPANAQVQNGTQSPITVCISGTGATREVQIFSCCGSQSGTLSVNNNVMEGPVGNVGDTFVNALFSGDVWEVKVWSSDFCPTDDRRGSIAPLPEGGAGQSRLARMVDAVFPAANAGQDFDYSWDVVCTPGSCPGKPAACETQVFK